MAGWSGDNASGLETGPFGLVQAGPPWLVGREADGIALEADHGLPGFGEAWTQIRSPP